MTNLEEWLGRMQAFKSDHAGPAINIQVTRNHRDVGWRFDMNAETNLAELVDHIDSACRDSGFAGPYELRAFDAEGRLCGPFQYKALVTEIVASSPGPSSAMLEGALENGLQVQTAFTSLALKGLAQAQRYTVQMVDRLQRENDKLHKEKDALQAKLDTYWEMIAKLNTHEVETQQETERVKRMGSLAETAVTALMGRLTGKGTNASDAIALKLTRSLFNSIGSDAARLQKVMELLSEEERLVIMELSRSTEPEPPPEAKANGIAASSAAAITNGKGN